MKSHISWFVVALAVLLSAWPASVQATDFKSSMKVTCFTSNCQQLRFHLTLQGDSEVDWIALNSLDDELWRFSRLVEARDANGVLLDWETHIDSDQVRLKVGRYLAPQPIAVIVEMHPFSGTSDLADMFTYQGLANSETGTRVVFEGTAVVTPEPATMILLGSGLAGMAGMARRRRRRDEGQV